VVDLTCPADHWPAKSQEIDGVEVSIFKHTEMLLHNYELLKSRAIFPLLNAIDDLLISAIRNHDRGKANLRLQQNWIRTSKATKYFIIISFHLYTIFKK